MPHIQEALEQRPTGPVHLVPFIPAGFGGYETTAAVLGAVADSGAGVIEVGIPFSDPVADGPTIQAAYHDALVAGTTLDGVFDCVRNAQRDVKCPMLAMVSYSVVFRGTPARFCERARDAGLSGLLCPDLPPPEAAGFARICKECGLEPILLVAPTTPPARRDIIGHLGGGFIYYLSVAGITGQRDALPPELAAGVADMKGRTDLPVCVGFGISRPEHVRSLQNVADGAVVGSAFVKQMRDHGDEGAGGVGRACGELAAKLLGRQ